MRKIAVAMLLSFLACVSPSWAAAYTIDAGNINAQVSEYGWIYDLIWPKGTENVRVYYAINGMAFERGTAWDHWFYALDASGDYSGFFENTSKASQEVRNQYGMRLWDKTIRTRMVSRAFASARYPTRWNEIEVIFEYKNVMTEGIKDFYPGALFQMIIPFKETTGDLTDSKTEITYNRTKQMFWFGDDTNKFYAAVLMTVNTVHTAKLKDSYWTTNYSDFTEGTYPTAAIASSSNYPMLFFSSREAELIPEERVYQAFVIAFAQSRDDLLGAISRLSGTTAAVDVDLAGIALIEGPPPPPSSGTSGGCLVYPGLKSGK